MMMKVGLLHLFLLFLNTLLAQNDASEGNKRLNFAKTYVEIGSNIYPSFNGHISNSNGEIIDFKNPTSASPVLNIGGYHFWGHGDFYISIPLASLPFKKTNTLKTEISESVVTGLRFLPWAFKSNQLTPFMGGTWVVSNFKQSQNGSKNPIFEQNALRFDAGFLYGTSTWQIRVGLNYYPKNKSYYPVNETHFQTIETPPFSANLGFIYAFETTSKGVNQAEMNRLNSFNDFSNPIEKQSPKGDWFFGIGPSSAFILTKSSYNQQKHPYFNPKSISKTYFDFTLGYHFNQSRIVTTLAFRSIPYKEKAFDIEQKTVKNSLITEGYYFLTDYNGFTPFLGINLGIDKISVKENNLNQAEKTVLSTGFTFGWDILPNKTEQPFVLRTNLRWFPFQKIEINGYKHSLNQLEYNVIQAVWYPSRKQRLKKQ